LLAEAEHKIRNAAVTALFDPKLLRIRQLNHR
jgi:hypothetical protein